MRKNGGIMQQNQQHLQDTLVFTNKADDLILRYELLRNINRLNDYATTIKQNKYFSSSSSFSKVISGLNFSKLLKDTALVSSIKVLSFLLLRRSLL